jgi:hypothetical protein
MALCDVQNLQNPGARRFCTSLRRPRALDATQVLPMNCVQIRNEPNELVLRATSQPRAHRERPVGDSLHKAVGSQAGGSSSCTGSNSTPILTKVADRRFRWRSPAGKPALCLVAPPNARLSCHASRSCHNLPTLPVVPTMKIQRDARKNPVERVMRVNNRLRVADHTPDKVVFLGTIGLTGPTEEVTSPPVISPIKASYHVRTQGKRLDTPEASVAAGPWRRAGSRNV